LHKYLQQTQPSTDLCKYILQYPVLGQQETNKTQTNAMPAMPPNNARRKASRYAGAWTMAGTGDLQGGETGVAVGLERPQTT
jgi:hypothetical protein